MKTKFSIFFILLLLAGSFVKAEKLNYLNYREQIIGTDTLFYALEYAGLYFGIPNKLFLKNSHGISEVIIPNCVTRKIDNNTFEIYPKKYGEILITVKAKNIFQIQTFAESIPEPDIRINGENKDRHVYIPIDEIDSLKIEVYPKWLNYKIEKMDLSWVNKGFWHEFQVKAGKIEKQQLSELNKGIEKLFITNVYIQGPDSSLREVNGLVCQIVNSKIEAKLLSGIISKMPLKNNLRIKITGNPAKEDIQTVKNIVATLDSLVESIDIKIVDYFPSFIIDFDTTTIYTEPGQVVEYITRIDEKSNNFYPYDIKTRAIIGVKETSQKERIRFLWQNLTQRLIKVRRQPINSIFNSQEEGLLESDKAILKLFFSKEAQKPIQEFEKKQSKGFSSEALLIVLFSLILFLITLEIDNYFRFLQKIRNTLLRQLFSYALISQLVLLSICFVSGFQNIGLQRYILPFALVCGFIFYFADSFLKKIKKSWVILLAEPVISFGVLYIGYQVVYIFTRGELLKWQFINDTCLLISFSIVMVRFLIRYQTIKIGQAISEKDTKITQQNELLVRAQLNALQARITPHFLYNALNSIAELSRTNASRTEEMTLALSNLFRYNVNREGSMFSTISEEMEMINLYLFVEKQRFNERLNYIVDVDKNLEKVEIPKFLLQPLVENAVKHGISKITDNGCIKIEIKRVDHTIEMKIFDNGPNFPEGIINGYGLQNTYEKLDLIYQKPYEIRFINGEQKHILIILKNSL